MTLQNIINMAWKNASKDIMPYSSPTSNQGWGTLEIIDYIFYTNPTNYTFKTVSFGQIPKFDVAKVDTYFDELVKHGYLIPHQEIIDTAQKDSTVSRVDILNTLKFDKLKNNPKPPVGFKPYGDFPSDHAILIAEFDIDTSKLQKKPVQEGSVDKLARALRSIA